MTRVLIVDDEAAILRLVAAVLDRGGFTPVAVSSARAALAEADRAAPDAAVIDLGLPDMDGIELVAALRQRMTGPLIVLTAREATSDKIAALDLGADDYVTKPFDGDELLARLRAALRRAGRAIAADGVLRHGALAIDPARHDLRLGGERVTLTPREFAVMEALIAAGGRLVTHADLLRRVWGPAHVGDSDYLRVVVRALRLKLEADPSAPTLIRNEPGIGYRLGEV
ncbi:MAG: response regulator transcription factor [Sphingopyxis sp.]|nr:response regulator transcription factor [Sphingopyxis sp.]